MSMFSGAGVAGIVTTIVAPVVVGVVVAVGANVALVNSTTGAPSAAENPAAAAGIAYGS